MLKGVISVRYWQRYNINNLKLKIMKTVNEFIKENNIEWFVTASDKFLSGWGRANRKTSKIVVCCKSLEQAREIAMNYESRSDLNRINICGKKPCYSPNRYDVSYYDFDLNLI